MSNSGAWHGQARRRVRGWIQLDWGSLRDWPWMLTLRTLLLRVREDRLGMTAGSLTFTTLIALVPLVTVTLALFTAFPVFAKFQGDLQQYFVKSLVPEAISKPVLGYVTQFASKASRLGSIGLVLLGGTAIALMLTIDRTLNAIWRVKEPRPIAQRVLVYWAAVTLGPLLLGGSLSLTSLAISASKGWLKEMPGGINLLLDVLQFSLQALGATALFRFVPNTHVRWRHAFMGGLWVAAGITVSQMVLGWYLRMVPTYAAVYGAFATLPILLVWVYISWLIVLQGAVLAAYAPSLAMRVVRRDDVPGLEFSIALEVLSHLDGERGSPMRGLDHERLAARMRLDPLQLEPVLETLARMDWVARLDEVGRVGLPRWVMLVDPEQTPLRDLVAHTLLEPDARLQTFWRHARFEDITLAEVLEEVGSQF